MDAYLITVIAAVIAGLCGVFIGWRWQDRRYQKLVSQLQLESGDQSLKLLETRKHLRTISSHLKASISKDQTIRQLKRKQRSLLKRIDQLLAGQAYDNDPLQDSTVLKAAELAAGTPVTVYRLRQQNEPVAAVYDLVTPNGYSGSIRLVVGVNSDQLVSGVRIVSHRETPGLGDKIELAKSDWVLSFNGKSLHDPAEAQWAVRKDGGTFDQFTGATITPRAIVSTVRDVLRWSAQHQQRLFKQAATEYAPAIN